MGQVVGTASQKHLYYAVSRDGCHERHAVSAGHPLHPSQRLRKGLALLLTRKIARCQHERRNAGIYEGGRFSLVPTNSLVLR
jgi:hypothetical protein